MLQQFFLFGQADLALWRFDIYRFRVCLERGKTFPFLRFFCEIELIPVKILRNSCEIFAFQTGPRSSDVVVAELTIAILRESCWVSAVICV